MGHSKFAEDSRLGLEPLRAAPSSSQCEPLGRDKVGANIVALIQSIITKDIGPGQKAEPRLLRSPGILIVATRNGVQSETGCSKGVSTGQRNSWTMLDFDGDVGYT